MQRKDFYVVTVVKVYERGSKKKICCIRQQVKKFVASVLAQSDWSKQMKY